MKRALCVITDGRADYLAETLESAHRFLPEFDYRFIVDDSGSQDYASWLRCNYTAYSVIQHKSRKGMAGAVRSAFGAAAATDAAFSFHLEDDMVLLRELPIVDAIHELCKWIDLAQVTFKREPWWGREVDLGDQLAAIVEAAGESKSHPKFTTHDHIFSLNPCVIPRRVFEQGWPDGNEAEQTQLMRGHGFRFAMWGHESDLPYVRHIGAARAAGWQL